MFRALVCGLAAVLLGVVVTPDARATSCTHPSLQEALLGSDLVAAVTTLEVQRVDRDFSVYSQRMRVRLERVFKAPRHVREGAETWISIRHSNSSPASQLARGGTWIAFLQWYRAGWEAGPCSTPFESWSATPVPPYLLELRRRRLERED